MSVSRTAQYVALYRALETVEPRREPLFRDPYAKRFLSRPLRAVVALSRSRLVRRLVVRYADRRAPGARTSAMGRTRFIDDAVRAAIGRGTKQVVLLGAGFDCRAHRMPELAAADVYEVDRAPTQAMKRARVPPSRVRYVAVDFLRDDTFERLAAAGWRRDRPTIFVWEGVTNYLTEDAVARVLAAVGASAAGTGIVFTYLHRGVLDGSTRFKAADTMLANVRKLGEPWTFGLRPEDLAPFVARAGLEVVEDLGADEYRARYFPPGEDACGYAFYRIALARHGRDRETPGG